MGGVGSKDDVDDPATGGHQQLVRDEGSSREGQQEETEGLKTTQGGGATGGEAALATAEQRQIEAQEQSSQGGQQEATEGLITIGDVLEQVGERKKDKPITPSDAAAIRSAATKAVGHATGKGSVGSHAQSAANFNLRSELVQLDTGVIPGAGIGPSKLGQEQHLLNEAKTAKSSHVRPGVLAAATFSRKKEDEDAEEQRRLAEQKRQEDAEAARKAADERRRLRCCRTPLRQEDAEANTSSSGGAVRRCRTP
ncbi:hypothetical protein CBR_g8319 [Chara braunii]|uniref:SMP domain-containing protein n=1 Tax=Chara braunii TaxID=69332 RepID=A0A388KLV2_CHABU|nr:hypothetical protein CBR_g8319 [Chara braunii]|eukprot:GBG71021.1 hypothetical protein CBR_g8319 [Chara braunii]